MLHDSLVRSAIETRLTAIRADYMPWPKSAPTNKSAVAKGAYDLNHFRQFGA